MDWRGFELHPETPKGGIEFKRRFPEKALPEGLSYIQKFAARFGIDDMKRAERIPNTRRALAMAEFARDEGKLDKFRSLTMDAHWREDKDIEDTAILKELAAAAGLDPEKALLAADAPAYLKRVDDVRIEYKKVRTGGIPTFVFGKEIVEGCQPYEVLVGAAGRGGARRR